MNCFEWSNHSSDYLDGTLSKSTQDQADEHLKVCPDCTERLQHYRFIVSSISHQLQGPVHEPGFSPDQLLGGNQNAQPSCRAPG